VYLDAPGAEMGELYINGGQRGVNLRLRVADLLTVTGARVIEASQAGQTAQMKGADRA
jgi:Cys-tRNA(Pro)/Cys-tRNA(Cys) deacylase